MKMGPAPGSNEDLADYLSPTYIVDSDSEAVRQFAQEATEGANTERERAVRLFYAVRDGIRYDPYGWTLEVETFKASRVLANKAAFCVPKAVLLAASARAVGIPARLGFADVRNHLTTKKLRERMGTDIFLYHGFTELFLEGKWIRVTPTFNLSLCDKFGVKPLDWDGETDALFHPFDKERRKHMEYIRYHGSFADVPVDRIVRAFAEFYDHLKERLGSVAREGANFEKEAEQDQA